MAVTSSNGASSSVAQPVPSWILLSNLAVASLEKSHQHTTASGVRVYGQGTALTSGAYTWLDGDATPRDFHEWATSIEVKAGLVRFQTAAMNNPPLYAVQNTTSRAWAVGSNPFILNVARSQWGMPIGFVDPTVINRDSTTSFQGVSQLPPHTYFELKKDGNGWLLSTQERRDPLFSALSPRITDYDEAGSAFVSAVQKAVSEITESDKEVASLLSGGIDSGAVTTFAVRAGLKVTAYSAGSPWGNEHEEAQELADFLGIPLVRLELSAKDLLNAVPETMRALGTAERERVDIQITLTALMRSGLIKEKHILTGYGNDLMLIGLPPDSTDADVLIRDIITEVDLARHSGEFQDFVAGTWGKKLSHVYWHPDVVQTALDIHPSCKVHGGREKAFFRAAMEQFIPKTAAWRKKIGIHVGGGMQRGLDALFGGLNGKVEVYNRIFRALSDQTLDDPFGSIDHLAPRSEEPGK
ncbi:hypothetical protein GCG54_00010381 [Colletotrichum gloeosporioides]|uniref:Asparagine synthetase domain-containing protein n=1 Tax=Colletotrichum gloeosporioides TaxID=474922 RepID=A0A8H4CVR1_COLGL|nr:uncharacterized protein GCG54_00010381 [Colletotrichum gloeosporioides]KAF3811045.1 hypothetical protein GCG54_00010381 [Colletotrichum gloeosporioides]